jgi:hypothetical protein
MPRVVWIQILLFVLSPCSWGWQVHTNVFSHWLRWSLANFFFLVCPIT